MIQLDAHGYFTRAGKRFVPVGVNYWPASVGVEVWTRWPADEIRRDLDLLPKLGLNCLRFFLRWQDFEPEAGHYDPVMFGRFDQFLGWCGERGILAHPSLFVGFMSGAVYWPRWVQGRNPFSDPDLRARAAAFAEHATKVIHRHGDHVLAVDQGNELCCLAESRAAAPPAIREWCQAVNTGIRAASKGLLIVSGNEQQQVIADSGWRLGDQPGCDFYSMHGYPVSSWHAIGFDGMTDPLCQSLLPLYTKIARAFGPVMLQEFGTILTAGARQQDAYLRALLPAAWQAGANGFLWWCLRDISSANQPYTKHAFESTLGLVDDAGKVKPGLEYFVQFAQEVQAWPAATTPADAIGLYLPKQYYSRANPHSTDNEPRLVARGLCVANYMLQQLGHATRVVRGDQPLPADVRTLFIAGAHLGADEARALVAWVRGGGTLLWHAPDPFNWAAEYNQLIGAKPVDYRGARPIEINAFGQAWHCASFPRNLRLEVEPDTATVMARDTDGLPVLLRRRLGPGTVITGLPMVDETIASVATDRAARDRWLACYRGMLELAQSR
jgi:hypothetical protein